MQAGLDDAARAADAASSVLVSINKDDITEIKSFANPPAQVKMTMEAVCILLGHKPDWPTAKKLLKMPDFLTQLNKYDKDNIDPKKIKQLQEYVTKDDFNPTNMGKVSKAAGVLCKWCCAMEAYNRVAKALPKGIRCLILERTINSTIIIRWSPVSPQARQLFTRVSSMKASWRR
jgi:dynein heavy chain